MSWANTPDRSARTAAARRASHHTRFLDQAREMHPDASEKQIAEVAESLRKAHYSALALKSAAARRAKRDATQAKKRAAAQQQIAEYRPAA
jgi:hypothetical protein